MPNVYYLSWVDKRTDPFPLWETLSAAGDRIQLGDTVVPVLPDDHPEWPGIPFRPGDQELVVRDPRMGTYRWPGLPYRDGRLFLGPTLSALFHPASEYAGLKGVKQVYLLHQPDRPDSPHELLAKRCARLARLRNPGAKVNPAGRVRLAPIYNVTDPTDHAAVMAGVQGWLDTENVFGRRNGEPDREATLVVNLSAGTSAMHACWLILRWSGRLGGPGAVIQFVQGDGGLGAHADRSPLRTVPVDALANFTQPRPAPRADERNGKGTGTVGPAAGEATPGGIDLDDLRGAPFDQLRERIRQAALLGLPILLHGERGTGKTFLARKYHDTRQQHRRAAPAQAADGRGQDRTRGGLFPPTRRGADTFVTVTLSEYADLHELRDTLFGWAPRSFTDAGDQPYDGLLGEADGGTLFLDEVHHLDRSLQAALLGPLNNRRYRPKMAAYEIQSHFDLVVATNDPQWRAKLAEDFRDRIERIVLEVPSFRTLQGHPHGWEFLRRFWEYALAARCRECGMACPEPDRDPGHGDCRPVLEGLFRSYPFPGNWRDLHRLADNLLMEFAAHRDGRPAAVRWDRRRLERAVRRSLDPAASATVLDTIPDEERPRDCSEPAAAAAGS
jgi:Sigma-54 interaction domain